jgi:hypothetical protein
MSRQIRRPSAATVIAMVALFVALSGSSYAALKANSIGAKQIKANAVRADEIRDGSVGPGEVVDESLTGTDVTNESLGSGDVAGLNGGDVSNGSIGLEDLSAESVDGSKIADGSVATGDVANESLTGDDVQDDSIVGDDVARLGKGDIVPGAFLDGRITVQFEQAPTDLADGTNQSYNVFCPAGQIAIGGGGRGDDTLSEQTTIGTFRPAKSPSNTEPPFDDQSFSGWRINVVNPAGGAASGIKPEVWVICAG